MRPFQRGRRHEGHSLAVLALLASLSACKPAGPDASPVQFARHAPAGSMDTEGWVVRGLDPSQQESAVPLPAVPDRSRLVFTIGCRTADQRMDFEILRRTAAGDTASLYRRTIPCMTWTDDEVDLGPRRPPGDTLVFRKTASPGSFVNEIDAIWGDPVVLPPTPGTTPLVVLVSLDTLRADYVRAYAPQGTAVTPALDGLAREGVLFRTAYSTSTWTLPSHRALLSGRFPADLPLQQAFPSIAETIRDAGYLTAGFTGGGWLGSFWGLGSGFDRYFEFTPPDGSGAPACTPARLDGPEVFRHATKWLERFGRHGGFLFVHTYDAHDRCPFQRNKEGFEVLQRQDLANIQAHYATMVTAADRLLGDLLGTIDALKRTGPTIVVVTSDHGEALFEHATAGHGPDMRPYEELVRIPLIVRGADFPRGRAVDDPVALVDVAPTLLAAIGLPVPNVMRGRVLPGLGLPTTREPPPVWIDAGTAVGLRLGPLKLVSQPAEPQADQLFDVVRDPGETTDVRPQSATAYDALKARAVEYARGGTGAQTPDTGTADQTLQNRLRELGYLD